jgi:hypothetical protein
MVRRSTRTVIPNGVGGVIFRIRGDLVPLVEPAAEVNEAAALTAEREGIALTRRRRGVVDGLLTDGTFHNAQPSLARFGLAALGSDLAAGFDSAADLPSACLESLPLESPLFESVDVEGASLLAEFL